MAGRLAARAGVVTDLARLAADCFALLFSAAPEAGGINDGGLAAWALAQFALSFALGADALNVAASVGWAHAGQVQGQADELLAAAEQALAHAKATVRGRAQAYDPAEHLLETARRWAQANIDVGLERAEFRLLYQPLVRLSDRQLLGFEALIRWPHPSRGLVMPDEFIRHAEASGQIVLLSGWIMREAARQLRAWDALGFTGEIAINLSAVQFSDRELLQAEARAVLALALDKQVIAEGIDDERQAQLLQELGVHVGQGWLFAKALPAEAAEALILGPQA